MGIAISSYFPLVQSGQTKGLSFFCLFRKKKLSSEGLKKRAERKRDEAAPWGKLSRKAISSNRAAAVTAFSQTNLT